MRSVFITRSLDPDSLFRTQLEAAGFTVHGESLVHFEAIPFEELPATDWIFFYSKKAVQFFFSGILTARLTLGSEVRLAALGPGTAAGIRSEQREVAFTGSGEPAEAAREFLKVAAGRRVLFPRAAHSRRSVQRALRGAITIVDLVVYHNEAHPDPPGRSADVLVFTSPLNARAYFAVHRPLAGQQVIAIGPTTAGVLQQLGIPVASTAGEPSEEAMAGAVLKIVERPS